MAGGARCSSLLRGFLSLFFVMFLHVCHAGCCFSPGSSSQQHEEDEGAGVGSSSKRRKISPLAFSPAVSSSTIVEERARAKRRHVSSLATNLRCYLHRIFSSSGPKNAVPEEEEAVTTTTVSSSPLALSVPLRQASLMLSTPSSPCASPFLSPMSSQSLSVTPVPFSPQATRQLSRSFAARGDLFPCKVCGEVLTKPQQLELHQAMKHSLSELTHVDSSMNIIRMIFLAGWSSGADGGPPTVRRRRRSPDRPAHPQDTPQPARSLPLRRVPRPRPCPRRPPLCGRRLGRRGGGGAVHRGRQRAAAVPLLHHALLPGRRRVREPLLLHLHHPAPRVRRKQADVDGIATYSSGWAAHASLPEDVEREFAFLQVRRAMLVCRVVAGRVVRCGATGDGNKVAYDSMVPVTPAGGGRRGEDDAELLVFNPRAVLPCFVIMYSS